MDSTELFNSPIKNIAMTDERTNDSRGEERVSPPSELGVFHDRHFRVRDDFWRPENVEYPNSYAYGALSVNLEMLCYYIAHSQFNQALGLVKHLAEQDAFVRKESPSDSAEAGSARASMEVSSVKQPDPPRPDVEE